MGTERCGRVGGGGEVGKKIRGCLEGMLGEVRGK